MEVKKTRTIYISLADPISIVTEAFRNQAINTLITKTERGVNQASLLYYDPSRYMVALLKDIFRNEDPIHNFNSKLPSTRILIRDGLQKELANHVGYKTYMSVCALIQNFLPDRDFTNTCQYNYDLMDDKDICIAPKVATERDHPDDVAISIEQEFQARQRAFEENMSTVLARASSVLIAHELAEANKAALKRNEEEEARVLAQESAEATALALANWERRVAEAEQQRLKEKNEVRPVNSADHSAVQGI